MVVSGGVTPGPFPNPEAKPTCADGTAPGRVWESKSPPALKLKIKGVCTFYAYTLPFFHALFSHFPVLIGIGG